MAQGMKKWRYFIIGIFIYVLAIFLISFFEKNSENANIQSFTDALWYAIVTLTTVGYGDYFPVTTFGKIVGLLLIIGSIGILGYIIGEITTRFNQYMEKKKNGFWGTDFSNHYIIIGWSDFGRQVAEQIFNTGHKVAFVVNSKNDLELINDIFSGNNSFCMFADFNNLDAYAKANIDQSKGVFINFSDDSESLVFVLNLKKAYPNADIVVTVNNASLKETFKSAGIQHVVARDEVTSRLVASYIFEPQVAALTEDLISTSVLETDFDIQQYKMVDNNPLIGQKYIDVFFNLKKKYGAVLIAMVVNGKLIKNPSNDSLINENDYLILISEGNCKKQLEKDFGIKEGE
jgi:voltage-gated potassium channel